MYRDESETLLDVGHSQNFATAFMRNLPLCATCRGPSDAVPAAPLGRLILIGEVQQAVRGRTRAASCRLAARPSTGTASFDWHRFRERVLQTDRQFGRKTHSEHVAQLNPSQIQNDSV